MGARYSTHMLSRTSRLVSASALCLLVGMSVSPAQAALIGTPQQIAGGLSTPWEVVVVPGDKIYVTELPGRVRVISGGVLQTESILTAPTNTRKFLGLTLHPDYATNKYVYLYHGYTTGGGCSTNPASTPCKNKVVRYTDNGTNLVSPVIILDNIPSDGSHDGGRIKFGPDGKLYVTTGDIHNPTLPQDLASLNGKILRINADGTVPADNPFASQAGRRGEIWTYGHRHPQGIAWNASGEMYESEHGPSGESYTGSIPNRCCRDEINKIDKGTNYGWPSVVGSETATGMRSPIIHSGDSSTWAPAGAAFGNDDQLYVPNLSTATAGHRIRAFAVQSGSVLGQLEYYAGTYGRLRTATYADGQLYFTTSNNSADEKVYRVAVSQRQHPDGTLVRQSNGAIYLLEAGQRRYVPSPNILLSNGLSFSRVKTASSLDTALPAGANLSFREGSLVRPPSGAIYAMDYSESTPQKRHITNYPAFTGLGYTESEVMNVSDPEVSGIASGSIISDTSRHPDGTLVRQSNGAIYLLQADLRRYIPSPNIMTSHSFTFGRVKNITTAETALGTGSNLGFREGTVVRGPTGAIYVIDLNGTTYEKRHITNYPAFLQLGYTESEVMNVSSAELPATDGTSIG